MLKVGCFTGTNKCKGIMDKIELNLARNHGDQVTFQAIDKLGFH